MTSRNGRWMAQTNGRTRCDCVGMGCDVVVRSAGGVRYKYIFGSGCIRAAA
jgi:hypothetical protein